MGFLLAGGAFMICLYLAIFVLTIVAYWTIFTKAGKPGWACLIPIYNVIVFLEIIGKPWWWLILFCIPFVNFIFMIWALNMLSKSFGYDTGFTSWASVAGHNFRSYFGPWRCKIRWAGGCCLRLQWCDSASGGLIVILFTDRGLRIRRPLSV